uniref:Putative secreted protein n=1 Tax=Amblyomma parvum TaxID=251391 RepID=A0A023FZD4_AMBPA
MKVYVLLVLALILLPEIDNAVSQEHIKALTSDTHVMQIEGYSSAIHPRPSFESREDSSRKGKGKRRRKEKKRSTSEPMSFNVTVLQDGTNVTYITRGNHTFEFLGNWTLHVLCLAPCNVNKPRSCTRRGPNCTCVARNDLWGRKVGVCAMKNVPLGSGDYGRTTAFLPKT